jgi:hypothetical protein
MLQSHTLRVTDGKKFRLKDVDLDVVEARASVRDLLRIEGQRIGLAASTV